MKTGKAKHTPGPWYTTSTEESRQGLISAEVSGVNVAVSYDPKDAHIIAAAPEMLEALTDLVGGCGKEGDLLSDAAFAAARAAIAKAEGRDA